MELLVAFKTLISLGGYWLLTFGLSVESPLKCGSMFSCSAGVYRSDVCYSIPSVPSPTSLEEGAFFPLYSLDLSNATLSFSSLCYSWNVTSCCCCFILCMASKYYAASSIGTKILLIGGWLWLYYLLSLLYWVYPWLSGFLICAKGETQMFYDCVWGRETSSYYLILV